MFTRELPVSSVPPAGKASLRCFSAALGCLLLAGAVLANESDPRDVPAERGADPQIGSSQPEGGGSDATDQWHPATDESSPPLISPEMLTLRDSVRRTLGYYFHRPETTAQRSPWGVMHSIVGFGVDTPLRVDNQTVNAIAWLCANSPCANMRLLYRHGNQLGVRMGPGYQGHEGQFLCILAQSRVKRDYPLLVDGWQLSIAHLIEHEKSTCRSGQELTFKLIGLAHYLGSEETWQNDRGETWSVARLIREELAQPVVGAACGGTHRLTGFSYAVRTRRREGEPIDGQWLRAEKYLQDYHRHTFRLQNADGSFSTAWFERPGASGDIGRRLNTTGHILEWLAFSLPDEELLDRRMVRAVQYLNDLMWTYRQHPWEIGPKGHAIHALVLYDERVFGGQPGKRGEQLALVREM